MKLREIRSKLNIDDEIEREGGGGSGGRCDDDARAVPRGEKMKKLGADATVSAVATTQDNGDGAAVVNWWLRE
ncbi:hypothetical protein PIB30_084238, partial [Stylosanthes scabra]|nr:hypothetical protein [Stylosanthes scabra]